MLDSIEHIANIAKMEHRLPQGDSSSTLWDGDEHSVRFVLEEGKLNLSLRLMSEYQSKMATLRPPSPQCVRSFCLHASHTLRSSLSAGLACPASAEQKPVRPVPLSAASLPSSLL